MKSLIKYVIVLLIALPLHAQKNDIKTYSVSLENFINFIAANYEYQEPEEEIDDVQNITFLIQVANANLLVEDLVILRQGFKLLSERLNDYNSISIMTYFGYNGVALELVAPSDLESINSTLKNLKSSINEFGDDGIEMAYTYVNKNSDAEATNSIVIIRNSNASKANVASLTKKEIKKLKRKKKKKEILKVAVSLVPEIIAILKN